MKKKKVLTFNLCEYDDLALAFTNRKGKALYTICFLRPTAFSRSKKETPQTLLELRFNHLRGTAGIEVAHLTFDFRAKDALRSTNARTHDQRITLNGPLEVDITGADGLHFGTFVYTQSGEQVQFNALHADDGSGYSFFCFPPDAQFKPEPERKVAK